MEDREIWAALDRHWAASDADDFEAEHLIYQEDAVLNRDDWTSALLGMGIVPRNVDAMATGVPLDRATEAMNSIADELAEFAARTPNYSDYFAQITRAR